MATFEIALWVSGIVLPFALAATTLFERDSNVTPADDTVDEAFDEERKRDARVHPFNGRWS